MAALTLTRKQLTDLHCCQAGLEWFDSRATGGQIVYPNGFDQAEVQRLGTQQPRFLKWLAKHGLIGMTLAEARTAVAQLLGKDPGFGPHDDWRLD